METPAASAEQDGRRRSLKIPNTGQATSICLEVYEQIAPLFSRNERSEKANRENLNEACC